MAIGWPPAWGPSARSRCGGARSVDSRVQRQGGRGRKRRRADHGVAPHGVAPAIANAPEGEPRQASSRASRECSRARSVRRQVSKAIAVRTAAAAVRAVIARLVPKASLIGSRRRRPGGRPGAQSECPPRRDGRCEQGEHARSAESENRAGTGESQDKYPGRGGGDTERLPAPRGHAGLSVVRAAGDFVRPVWLHRCHRFMPGAWRAGDLADRLGQLAQAVVGQGEDHGPGILVRGGPGGPATCAAWGSTRRRMPLQN